MSWLWTILVYRRGNKNQLRSWFSRTSPLIESCPTQKSNTSTVSIDTTVDNRFNVMNHQIPAPLRCQLSSSCFFFPRLFSTREKTTTRPLFRQWLPTGTDSSLCSSSTFSEQRHRRWFHLGARWCNLRGMFAESKLWFDFFKEGNFKTCQKNNLDA